uniref:CSON009072 protein n=1 Tax=Culicoides sonorensis TaxID=179676 RepID=A0A336N0Q6_CULSO
MSNRDEAEFTTSFWDVSSSTHYNVYQMGVGTTNGTSNMVAAGPGLLKRRYSVPEIIMRKHSLAQQKSYEESVTLPTAPTSVGSSGIKNKFTSDYRNENGGNGSNMNMGSDSNLSRSYAPSSYAALGNNNNINNNHNNTGHNNPYNNNNNNTVHHHSSGINKSTSNGHIVTGSGCIGSVYERNVEYSMRKELLRRLWSKDMKIVGRPSSLSPPSRRTTPRRLCFNSSTLTENPHQCEECQKLGVDRNSENIINNNNVIDSTPKRLKLSAGRSLDSSVIINHNNVNKNKSSPLSDSSSRPTTDSSQPIQSTTTASSAVQRADESISDFSDNTYINSNNQNNNNRKDEQLRKSVLIYMTSLENSLLVEENARDLLRVEIDTTTTGDTSTHIESDFADKTHFEESADSGNGDATQNLDNFSSGSISGGEETELKEAVENIKNNNLLLADTENNRNISDDNKNGNNEINNDEYESNLLNDNINGNNSSVPENENDIKSKETSRQTSVTTTNDSENNLLELIEKSNELELVENVAPVTNDKNGNRWRRRSPSPPLQFNEIVCADTIFPDRQYLHQRPTALHITSQSSTGHIQDVIVRDGTMSYFPSYSLVESRGDVSSYTSHTSDQEPEPISHVNSGSAYPELDYPYQVVVTRLSAIPRTMSMEVQPSSTSAEEELDDINYDSCDDDSISLVDSLDDPLSPRPNRKIRPKKSAEAFFIPISDPTHRIDDNLIVSDAMPDSLKERLDSRQIRRELKKESDMKKKRWKVQEHYSFERIERKPVKVSERGSRKENIPLQKKSKVKPFRENSSSIVVNASRKVSSVTKPQKKNGLRKEIGMLESYKIDARGNMQFQAAKSVQEPMPSRRAFKALPLDEPFVREPVLTSQKKIKQKPEREHVVRTVPAKIDRIDERRKQIIKDVQQMTLYQQADLTPDIEGGPRRMYQKTEIQEGDKRIEILEIVECVDTTPESSPAWSRGNPKTPRSSGLLSKTLLQQHSAKTPKVSKIIVESNNDRNQKSSGQKLISKSSSNINLKTPKSSGTQRLSRSNSRESSPNTSLKVNPNKDRAIADLLIDAMNSDEDPNVEFVQSPKDHLKSGGKRSVPRKVVTNGGSSRRSANSGKYLHQFEVIPEEKSGLSFDSSNEDALSSRAASQVKEPAVKKISEEEEENINKVESENENRNNNENSSEISHDNNEQSMGSMSIEENSVQNQDSHENTNQESSIKELERKSSKDSNDSATEGSVKSTFSSRTSVISRNIEQPPSEKIENSPVKQESKPELRPEPKQESNSTRKSPAIMNKSSKRARAAVKSDVATSKGWGNFTKPYHGSPVESANEGILYV